MRDPERLTSSKGLSDLERDLLDAGKNETMPAALREQMERALGLTGAAAAGGPVRARVEAATGVKASAIVWISAGVVVLAVVGGLVGVRLGSRLFPAREVVPVAAPAAPEQPASTAAPSLVSGEATRGVAVAASAPAGSDVVPGLGASASAATPPARRPVALAAAPVRLHSRAHAAASHAGTARLAGTRRNHASSWSSSSSSKPAAPVESAAAADTLADAPVADAPARAVTTSEPEPSVTKLSPARAAVAPSGDLRAEIDLIDGARGALRAGETGEAMDLLGQHAMHFPRGALAPEETALRVEALMRLGRTAEAKAYARRFVAANPASPLAERVRRLVHGDTTP